MRLKDTNNVKRSFNESGFLSINSEAANLERGKERLFELIDRLACGEVSLLAKVHRGRATLVECEFTERIYCDNDNSNCGNRESGDVTLEQMFARFSAWVLANEYGFVRLACKICNNEVTEITCIEGAKFRPLTEERFDDAA